jgi:HEAT repeat protein
VRRLGVGIVVSFSLLAVASDRGSLAASTPAPPAASGRAARKGTGKTKTVAEAKRPPITTDRLDGLRALLFGEDDPAALEAANVLGASGAPNAADPLVELLAAGASPARAQAALDALGKLVETGTPGVDRAIDVLELYAGHRAPELRQRAVKALGGVKEPRVVPVLLARLGDAAPDVRAASAEALAARRELKASPRLFALVKRGDAGAAAPLAALATPDLVPQIAELAGGVDDGVLATALGEYVKRDDVPDKLRVDVLRTINRLGGAAATTALVEYLASVPAKEARPSKKEAQKLLDERGTQP